VILAALGFKMLAIFDRDLGLLATATPFLSLVSCLSSFAFFRVYQVLLFSLLLLLNPLLKPLPFIFGYLLTFIYMSYD